LSHADRMAMQRAQGWLELKLPLEANEELDEVQPQLRAHPAVLKLRYQVYADAKQWPMAYEIELGSPPAVIKTNGNQAAYP